MGGGNRHCVITLTGWGPLRLGEVKLTEPAMRILCRTDTGSFGGSSLGLGRLTSRNPQTPQPAHRIPTGQNLGLWRKGRVLLVQQRAGKGLGKGRPFVQSHGRVCQKRPTVGEVIAALGRIIAK